MNGPPESNPPPASASQAGKAGETCPFCFAPVATQASKCPHCGSNIGDIRICPACAEPVRPAAILCPFCGSDLRPVPPPSPPLLEEPWTVHASNLGSFLTEWIPTSLIFPPVMSISESEIHIRRKSLLGLRTLDQKIAVNRIASVRALQGMIWGGIVVETYGGAAGVLSISGLNKTEARNTALVIERLASPKPAAR